MIKYFIITVYVSHLLTITSTYCTLNIKYKQNKTNSTNIPVTNTSGVKLPIETTSTTPHTHDKEITVMPVSN